MMNAPFYRMIYENRKSEFFAFGEENMEEVFKNRFPCGFIVNGVGKDDLFYHFLGETILEKVKYRFGLIAHFLFFFLALSAVDIQERRFLLQTVFNPCLYVVGGIEYKRGRKNACRAEPFRVNQGDIEGFQSSR